MNLHNVIPDNFPDQVFFVANWILDEDYLIILGHSTICDMIMKR
jgi:hypothetical protein